MDYAPTNDVEFEMLSLGAVVRNVAVFLQMSLAQSGSMPNSSHEFSRAAKTDSMSEKSATPDPAIKTGEGSGVAEVREETPVRAGAPRSSFAATELETAVGSGDRGRIKESTAVLAQVEGTTRTRSELDLTQQARRASKQAEHRNMPSPMLTKPGPGQSKHDGPGAVMPRLLVLVQA